jgi:hypothetical protein
MVHFDLILPRRLTGSLHCRVDLQVNLFQGTALTLHQQSLNFIDLLVECQGRMFLLLTVEEREEVGLHVLGTDVEDGHFGSQREVHDLDVLF